MTFFFLPFDQVSRTSYLRCRPVRLSRYCNYSVLDEVYQIAALKSGAYMVEPISQLEFLILMLWPGAAGGLASFLNGLRLQHYKNNKYLAKFGIEVLGGTVTASSLAYVFHEYALASVFAFLIGFAWSQVLQRLRTKITKIVEAALGD